MVEDNIQKGKFSLKGFLSVVGESIDERESRKFEEGLDSNVKYSLYRTFCKAVKFKAYLHGACDARSRLIFKFRSGIYIPMIWETIAVTNKIFYLFL